MIVNPPAVRSRRDGVGLPGTAFTLGGRVLGCIALASATGWVGLPWAPLLGLADLLAIVTTVLMAFAPFYALVLHRRSRVEPAAFEAWVGAGWVLAILSTLALGLVTLADVVPGSENTPVAVGLVLTWALVCAVEWGIQSRRGPIPVPPTREV